MRRQSRALGALFAVVALAMSTLFLDVSTTAQAADGEPELVGHWTFDDATFASGAADSSASNTAAPSGNCTTPTPSTNVPPSLASGGSRSLNLDGQGCLVITNPFRAVSGGHGVITDFTICSWINTTSQGTGVNHWNSAPILDGEVSGITNDFGFGLSQTGKLTFGTGRTNRTNDERIDGATTVNDGRWHHVCVTRDSTKTTGNVLLYVDGARETSTSSNGWGGSNQDAPTASPLAHIGWGQDDYHNRFVGFMDDMRAYNGVLDDAEIANLYSGSGDLQATADGEAPGTGDGVAASTEDAAPNGGDANADGVADRLQRGVASLPNAVDGQYTTLVLSAAVGACTLTSVTGINAPPDEGYAYGAGLTTFAADCDAGSTARIALYQYGETCNRLAVRSYDSASGTYSTVETATIEQMTIDGAVVAVGTFEAPASGVITGAFGIAQSTSACPVSPLNPLPVITIDGAAAPDSINDRTDTNTAWSLAIAASEPGPSPFTWSVSTPPAFGTASTSDSSGADVTLEYLPQSGFVGTDSVTVRLANGSGGFDYLTITLAIGPQIANVTAPEISVSGSFYVRDTLSMASQGSWNFSGTSGSGTRYQWVKVRGDSRTAINGATGPALVLTPDLVGADIVVEVTAWARFYAPASVSSDPVGPVLAQAFSASGAPTMSGTARAGEMLTAEPDADGWSPAATTFAYQWYADGVAIGGATGAEIVLGGDLVGADVHVEVTARAAGYAPTSVATAPVAVLAGVFSGVGVPTVSGNARAGETVIVDPDADGWSPAATTFAYQWFADGVAIGGATGRSFAIGSSQIGTTLTVTVMASRLGWSDAAATSAPTSAVTASATALADTGASSAAAALFGSALALLIGALLLVGRRRQRANA
jgi:LPXTG-motif cell wall-anchored protein